MKRTLLSLSIAVLTGALITLMVLMISNVYAQSGTYGCHGQQVGCSPDPETCQSCNVMQPPQECFLNLPQGWLKWNSIRLTRIPYQTCVTATETCIQYPTVRCALIELFGQADCANTCTENTKDYRYTYGCTP